jgi:hypothetical protein
VCAMRISMRVWLAAGKQTPCVCVELHLAACIAFFHLTPLVPIPLL